MAKKKNMKLRRAVVTRRSPKTTPRYWDCECEQDYIHPKSQKDCPRCEAVAGDQPDSMIDEVKAAGLPLEPNTKVAKAKMAAWQARANAADIEQRIFEAWFADHGGLVRPKSIRAKETGALFKSILLELTANVSGVDTNDDETRVYESLQTLREDLDRVEAAFERPRR